MTTYIIDDLLLAQRSEYGSDSGMNKRYFGTFLPRPKPCREETGAVWLRHTDRAVWREWRHIRTCRRDANFRRGAAVLATVVPQSIRYPCYAPSSQGATRR